MFGDDDDDDEYYPMSAGGRGDEPPPREPRLDLVPLKSALKKPRPPPEAVQASGAATQESAQG